ncbi:hypothetical protein BGX34_000860, partial [Mortierella sp. NVP85]
NSAGVTNLLLDTLCKLRTEQEEHLATAQKGLLLDNAYKDREKQILSSQLIIKLKERALVSYRKGLATLRWKLKRRHFKKRSFN